VCHSLSHSTAVGKCLALLGPTALLGLWHRLLLCGAPLEHINTRNYSSPGSHCGKLRRLLSALHTGAVSALNILLPPNDDTLCVHRVLSLAFRRSSAWSPLHLYPPWLICCHPLDHYSLLLFYQALLSHCSSSSSLQHPLRQLCPSPLCYRLTLWPLFPYLSNAAPSQSPSVPMPQHLHLVHNFLCPMTIYSHPGSTLLHVQIQIPG
jgi:hypothetical protein